METSYIWATTPEGATRMTLRNRGMPTGFSRWLAPLIASAMRRANRKRSSSAQEATGIARKRMMSTTRGQKRARSHGNAGIPGIPGNVVCVTYRIYRMPERPNPSLSANSQAIKYKGLVSFTSLYREWAIWRSALLLTFWREIRRPLSIALHRVTPDAAAERRGTARDARQDCCDGERSGYFLSR